MDKKFSSILRQLWAWDGADARELLPILEGGLDPLLLERDDEGFPIGLPPDWDVDVKKAIDRHAFIPEGLGDNDYWAFDKKGGHIEYRNRQWFFGVFENYEEDELAHNFLEWCRSNGLTVAEASKALGVGRRTLEGVAQGRGFRYPQLLRIGMWAVQKGVGHAE